MKTQTLIETVDIYFLKFVQFLETTTGFSREEFVIGAIVFFMFLTLGLFISKGIDGVIRFYVSSISSIITSIKYPFIWTFMLLKVIFDTSLTTFTHTFTGLFRVSKVIKEEIKPFNSAKNDLDINTPVAESLKDVKNIKKRTSIKR